MKKIIFILILFISSQLLFSQTKYWIYFKDKGEGVSENNVLQKNSALFQKAKDLLTEKAIERRGKVLSEDKIVDYSDIPVSEKYVQKISLSGIKIENELKWFNAVTSYLTPDQIETIKKYDFVKEIVPVKIFQSKPETYNFNDLQNEYVIPQTHKLKYGNSLPQLEMINVPLLHDIGITGTDVLVGMLDTGFRWRIHNALKTRRVIKEYDFVFKDSVTANQVNDASAQDNHGTFTFSALGGYAYDTLIGPAFNSDFILAKTEDVRSETRIEEDNWAAAIEWMENYGVEVSSTSLGYNTFDNNIGSYTYNDMNGMTTIITKAADIAVSKGVTAVNSAGNEGGSSWKYIIAPADGRNVIAVGAASLNGEKASFSSIGPTSDGRIKPDVSALGVSVLAAVAGSSNAYTYVSGTSLSCPLVGGVAALILSARPELTPFQVRDALRNTANRADKPDNLLGWGIIDAYKAVTYYGVVFSNNPETFRIISKSANKNGKASLKNEIQSDGFHISIFVASLYKINQSTIKVYYAINGSNTYNSVLMSADSILDKTNSGKYSVTIPLSGVSKLNYYFTASDSIGERRHPYTQSTKPQKTYFVSFDTSGNIGECKPEEFLLQQNFPNPFNSSTNINIEVPDETNLKVIIFNSLGQKVTELFNGKKYSGFLSIKWDGTDPNGNHLPSGVYYYQVISDNKTLTKEMVLMK